MDYELLLLAHLLNLMADNPLTTIVLVVVCLLVLGLLLVGLRKKRQQIWGRAMPKKKREEFVKCLLGDIIHDGLFDALHRGLITEEEYRRWNKIMGESHDIIGLIARRRKLTPTETKTMADAIRYRLGHDYGFKPKLPKEADVPSTETKKETMADRIRNTLSGNKIAA